MTFQIGPTKFEELRDKRLPVALSKISLLGNLGRTNYGATDREKIEVVDKLEEAIGNLRKAYRIETVVNVRPFGALHEEHDLPPPPKPTQVPQGTARGGSSFESEVRWALDAIKRGDTKLAADRLKRCLTADV